MVSIARKDFNHGGTRQWAATYLNDCEIIVFLTQDAILGDAASIAQMVDCFADYRVAVAYGRQLPHVGANAIEAHARVFNYGEIPIYKNAASAASLGTKVFFCSNSFAAYNRKILMELGGFRDNLILGEDMEFAARAVQAGYANVYCASAVVRHSHGYTMKETFRRYFDIGVFGSTNTWMRERFGSHNGEGMRFIKSELAYLYANDKSAIPRALLQTLMKAAGYKLGTVQQRLPLSLKARLSMMPSFWLR